MRARNTHTACMWLRSHKNCSLSTGVLLSVSVLLCEKKTSHCSSAQQAHYWRYKTSAVGYISVKSAKQVLQWSQVMVLCFLKGPRPGERPINCSGTSENLEVVLSSQPKEGLWVPECRSSRRKMRGCVHGAILQARSEQHKGLRSSLA